jgi:PAS domain S-box-containing protein
MGLAGGYAYTRWDLDHRSRYWINHTHDVIEASLQLFPATQAVVTADRTLAQHPGPGALDAYRRAVTGMREAQRRLADLTRDNPAQAARMRVLDAAMDRWSAWADTVVATALAGDAPTAEAMMNTGSGRALMMDVRAATAAIGEAERRQLGLRTAQAARIERISLWMAAALTVLTLGGLLGLVVTLSRTNDRLIRAAETARRSQDALQTHEALMRAVFVNTPDYLLVLDVRDGGRFVVGDVNPALAKAFDVEPEAVRGRTLEALCPEDVAQPLIAHCQRVATSAAPVWSRTTVDILPGGPRIWEAIMAPVRNPQGAVDRIVGTIRDVTERVRAQERLAQSQRLESIGQLTGGVAHDFNNALQVIRGNLELLTPSVEADAGAQRRLANAIQGTERAAQLTSHLLAFARRQPLAPKVIDLSRQVRSTAELLKRTLGAGVEVSLEIASGVWPTLADPAQVESAILNLALNARDAMPSGGRIVIEVGNAALDAAAAAELEVAPGDFVRIAVRDTGEGIAPEVLARVFEPFFTTKRDGKGTGLGLSMVYGFVRQSQGAVRIASNPGEGAAVSLFLPRSDAAPAPEIVASAPARPAETRTILVVEDDPAVRSAAVGMLEALGYRCREADDALSALAAFGDGDGIDLVFSDVVMPGPLKASGFMEALRRRAPETPVLFTSGYAQDAIVHDGRLDAGVNLITKPYPRDALAQKIAQLLAA